MNMMTTLLFLAASPVWADDHLVFHSPSGIVPGAIATGDYAGMCCDMAQLTASFSQPPADCALDWGSSFAVGLESRKGYLACVSDPVASDLGVELGYGQAIRLGGLTRRSEKSGIRCSNPAGHGFSISKAKQRGY